MSHHIVYDKDQVQVYKVDNYIQCNLPIFTQIDLVLFSGGLPLKHSMAIILVMLQVWYNDLTKETFVCLSNLFLPNALHSGPVVEKDSQWCLDSVSSNVFFGPYYKNTWIARIATLGTDSHAFGN